MSDPNPMPAFPQPFIQNERGSDFPFYGYGMGGMTMRGYIATKALCGALANPSLSDVKSANWMAVYACECADALIAELANGSAAAK